MLTFKCIRFPIPMAVQLFALITIYAFDFWQQWHTIMPITDENVIEYFFEKGVILDVANVDL